MPDEQMWATFFDAPRILTQLDFDDPAADVVEFGCGYGTFTVAAAARTSGIIFALDLDPAMIEFTRDRAQQAGRPNVRLERRDFVAEGTGLADHCVGYAMLFNILHAEKPDALLREAWRVLRPGGRLGIMHWNYDPTTPRGPSLSIRPRPEQCRAWAEAAGFQLRAPGIRDLPPYHYGMVMERA